MKRKVTLLSACAALMLLGTTFSEAQNGVLLPQSQHQHEHGEECSESGSCVHLDHGNIKETITTEVNPLFSSQVTPRRGTESQPNVPLVPSTAIDTIHSYKDVNVVFGAGESSGIFNGAVNWPISKDGSAANPGDLYKPVGGEKAVLIGSFYSKNAVMTIADNNGEIAGALLDVRFYNSGFGSSSYEAYDPLGGVRSTSGCWGTEKYRLYKNTVSYDASKDAFRYGYEIGTYTDISTEGIKAVTDSISAEGNNYANSGITITGLFGNGAVLSPIKDPNSYTYYVPIEWHIIEGYAGHPPYFDIETFKFYGGGVDTAYTSTKDKTAKDDGKSLFIKVPKDAATLDAAKNQADYVRPTTVLLSGKMTADNNQSLDSIVIRDVQWYISRNEAHNTTIDHVHLTTYYPDWVTAHAGDPATCCHYNNQIDYDRQNVEFGHSWLDGKLVDAAVRIVDNADICVKDSIVDKTSTPYSIGAFANTKTNAMLVLPGIDDANGFRSNFRLKIGGNASMLHTQDSSATTVRANNPLEQGLLYSASVGGVDPAHKFPIVQKPIYLSGGTSRFTDELDQMDGYTDYPRGGSVYDHFIYNPDSVTIHGTPGSVYGVYGEYNGNTDIYTSTIAGYDTMNIIEFGPATTKQEKFYISSKGMLKNFTSSCHSYCDSLVIGAGGDPAPHFLITANDTALFIMSDADCCNNGVPSGIIFEPTGVTSIVDAFTNAKNTAGHGPLLIQAKKQVKFKADMELTPAMNNELTVLSDNGYINSTGKITYTSDTANLTIWAKGTAAGDRGCSLLDCNAGAVKIDGEVSYTQANPAGGKLLLIRSENDDVLMGDKFTFNSTAAIDTAGEMMVQAGQDIRIANDVQIDHFGPRSVLFEAKKTVAFNGKFVANMTEDLDNGDLTIKAGYPDFLPTADITNPQSWGTGTCVTNGYLNRDACQADATTGGDIWFGNDAEINLTNNALDDSVDVFIRAYNTIHMDGKFTYNMTGAGFTSKSTDPDALRDTTMLFAETGNVEAMNRVNAPVEFNIGATDSLLLLIQAGNALGNLCYNNTACLPASQWDGNVLFGGNKTFTLTHKGVGPTMISAARDIENQVGANFKFDYTANTNTLTNEDSLIITAGRHIETHAPYDIDYTGLTDPESPILIEAGHGCDSAKCKVNEAGTSLTDNTGLAAYSTPMDSNKFAAGGNGQGSILLFSKLDIKNPASKGTLYMKALNGNIESDPYLHSPFTYNTGNAAITIDHTTASGNTTLKAIDIKLHDTFAYDGTGTSADGTLNNGNLNIYAFDSILTRNFTYKNDIDRGSVSITTDKIKKLDEPTGTQYYCGDATGTIRQGHIVLGYGADCSSANTFDQILFDLDNNPNTVGANILIEAGMEGFSNRTDYKKNLYGGNITFDYMLIKPAVGNRTAGGYTKIHTPNGNIWGKDSLTYIGHEGDLLVDAGIGSADDNEAIRWNAGDAFGEGTAMQKDGHLGLITNASPNGSENTLNTRIPNNCNGNFQWRTGNIMMKGGSLTYPTNEGGYATFRTRAGYIDLYDKFDVSGMTGQLLVYAHSEAVANDTIKQYSDVSTRDFHYEPSPSGASVYFGADDNIMFNYGNGNGTQEYTPDVPCAATGVYAYDYDGTRNNLHDTFNPFYSTSYKTNIDECRSIFNVNTNGYQWYNQWSPDDLLGDGDPYIWKNGLHMLYRGGKRSCNKSGITGTCETPSNGARDIEMNFSSPRNGGFAAVANNYIDFFTKFTYIGGQGNGLENPSVGYIVGESVTGYGLYLKSRYQGAQPERRRITCFMCRPEEWPYVGFHDDARIHTENQKSLIEGPVIEFFGHAELDSYTQNNGNGKITLKGDSLIFHDSAIFDGTKLVLEPFTTDASARANNFRYGVMNDKNANKFYKEYGMAIQMEDRGTPVLELGYQRCNEPLDGVHKAPNVNSKAGKESTPMVGGDIIVAFKNGFSLPIYNTVVANHARISFVSDSLDGPGGEYVDTYIRTDLLRIRNKVEFYTGEGTGNNDQKNRRGVFKMSSHEYMDEVEEAGIYPHHLHMEPGSELSIPSEDSLIVYATTTVGGYGNIHENIFVKANGTIAPGYASLMEEDCCTPHGQGKLTVHNLTMEKDAIFRISIGRYNQCYDENGEEDGKNKNCTGTDVLQVEDSIFFNGKIPLHILLEGDKDLDAVLDPGCYLFLEYNDSLGNSKEYVKNFTLPIDRYQDNYFGLDYSTPGKVYLCVMQFPQPVVERYVKLPAVEGVTTTPNAGIHYVQGHQNFSFTAKYSGTPLKVTATGYYHGGPVDLDQTATILPDGSYQYTIMQVVQPYDVEFGPETSSVQVGNDYMGAPLVYAYKNILHINVEKEDIVSIYNMTGVLYRKIEVPAGNSKFTLDKGMYIVTLKDGSVHKIVIK